MKPCCGYPSVRDAVLAFQSQGLSSREVAAKTGKSTSHVINAARKAGSPFGGRPADIPALLRACYSLDAKAKSRGVTPIYLAIKILHAVSRDDLVDSVLDDGEQS